MVPTRAVEKSGCQKRGRNCAKDRRRRAGHSDGEPPPSSKPEPRSDECHQRECPSSWLNPAQLEREPATSTACPGRASLRKSHTDRAIRHAPKSRPIEPPRRCGKHPKHDGYPKPHYHQYARSGATERDPAASPNLIPTAGLRPKGRPGQVLQGSPRRAVLEASCLDDLRGQT